MIADDVGLFAVLDGAGAGAQVYDGVLAAAHVVLPQALRARAMRGALDGRDLVDGITELNAEMVRITQSNVIARGSTASIVALLAPPENSTAWIAWVGDCLALELRGDRLVPLFQAHTLVNEQRALGMITEEEARTSPFKRIVTKALAVAEGVDIGLRLLAIERRIVLCSDGLIDAWPDADAAHLALADLLARVEVGDAARVVVDAAVAREANDNVTAIVVEPQP